MIILTHIFSINYEKENLESWYTYRPYNQIKYRFTNFYFMLKLQPGWLPTPSPQQSSTETSQWSSDPCPVILLTMNSRKHKLWLFLELHLSVPKRLNKDSFYQTRAIITILILLLLELVPIQGILPESVFLLFSSTGFTPVSFHFFVLWMPEL